MLAGIGRRHTAADIERCYAEARAAGHTNINMDLIAGLPGETVEGFTASLRRAIELNPENITVHTLTLKRASNLVIDKARDEYGDVAEMLYACSALADAGYRPYYLYRQKGTLQNLENTGWCKPGFEGLYNIYIMEEVHTILSPARAAPPSWCSPAATTSSASSTISTPADYINGFDTVMDRKKGVSEFYARYLDPETTG